jgi:hypothetical protein
MTAVFLVRSQWTLPTVFGLISPARDTTMEMSQSYKFSRFCHMQSFSDAKRPACSARSAAIVSAESGVVWE